MRPTRVAPLAIFLREDAGWLLATPQPSPRDSLSHPAREVLDVLETRGASFFADLARATGRLASEVEDALWELVAAGLVTADGFENLRALLDPKRRRGEGKGRTARPRHAPGTLGAAAPHRRVARETVPKPSRASCCSAGASSSAMPPSREPLAPAWRESAGGAAPHGVARRNPRRPLRLPAFIGEQFALPEALICCARSAARARLRWNRKVFTAPASAGGSVSSPAP